MPRNSPSEASSRFRAVLDWPIRFSVPSLVRALWDESPYEAQRRKQRLVVLLPIGIGTGFVFGSLTYEIFGIAVIAWVPLCSVVGFGVVYLVARLETFVRTRARIDVSRGAHLLDLAADALAGALLAGAMGGVLGWHRVNAPVVGALAVAGLGALWRYVAERLGVGLGEPRDTGFDDDADYSREHTLIERGQLDEALALFEEQSVERGGHPGPLVEAGHVLRDRGDDERSIEYYAKAMEVSDMDARRAAMLAKFIWDVCSSRMGDPERAVSHLEALVGRYPDAREVDWAWRELTVGMVVTQESEQDRLGAQGGHVPAVKAVERILSGAFVVNASDIHLEDHAGGLRVRYRVDGLLQDVDSPPDRISAAVLSRLRVMAGMNPAQSPIPVDARMRIPFAGRNVNVRVSTVPTLYGESMALRILDTSGLIDLDGLGLGEHDAPRLAEVIKRSHGMVLTTGPGGSGKSTTLRAIVAEITTGREKIFTVEDPVEYAMEGACQVSVNEKAGLTFAGLLRSLVRQDPDVLLIGEIRDRETAEIATHAALTGHLILSTLHSTDAVSALHRMVDIGVPDYLVVHTLEAILAQRLVRRVCQNCAEEQEIPAEEIDILGPSALGLSSYRKGSGCERCRDTGYKGRIGIYELLIVVDDLREAFLTRKDRRELHAISKAGGMNTLREDGIEKIRAGITTPDEVLRVT